MIDRPVKIKKLLQEIYHLNKLLRRFELRHQIPLASMLYIYEYLNNLEELDLKRSQDERDILEELRPLYEQHSEDWDKQYQDHQQRYNAENQLIRLLKPQLLTIIDATSKGEESLSRFEQENSFSVAIAIFVFTGRNPVWFEQIDPYGIWLPESKSWLDEWIEDKGRWHLMLGDQIAITSRSHKEFVTDVYSKAIQQLRTTAPEYLSNIRAHLEIF